jgi:hypothetical protein
VLCVDGLGADRQSAGLGVLRGPGESFDHEIAAEPLCCIERDSMVAKNLVFRRSC